MNRLWTRTVHGTLHVRSLTDARKVAPTWPRDKQAGQRIGSWGAGAHTYRARVHVDEPLVCLGFLVLANLLNHGCIAEAVVDVAEDCVQVGLQLLDGNAWRQLL